MDSRDSWYNATTITSYNVGNLAEKQKMNTYKITKTENYEVALNNKGDYGYFEHLEFGDMQSGGLWFDNGELYDYDGVYELPKEVVQELKNRGVDASYADTHEEDD